MTYSNHLTLGCFGTVFSNKINEQKINKKNKTVISNKMRKKLKMSNPFSWVQKAQREKICYGKIPL